jgi:RNA polymerase sigma factor (sigma-70 family)
MDVAYKKLTDAQLVEKLNLRDEAAFGELYLRYGKTLHRHIYNKINDKNLAADIVHDLFLSLWVAVSEKGLTLRPEIKSYLYQSAKNHVINLALRDKRYKKYILAFKDSTRDPHDAIAKRLDAKKLLEKIEQEVFSFPKKVREVFYMSRKEKLSHREIAIATNTSVETVRKQINEALRRLKEKFGIMVLFFSWWIS